MSDDMLKCDKASADFILRDAGVKTVDELAEKYENEISRLRKVLWEITTAPSASRSHSLARKGLGLF